MFDVKKYTFVHMVVMFTCMISVERAYSHCGVRDTERAAMTVPQLKEYRLYNSRYEELRSKALLAIATSPREGGDNNNPLKGVPSLQDKEHCEAVLNFANMTMNSANCLADAAGKPDNVRGRLSCLSQAPVSPKLVQRFGRSEAALFDPSNAAMSELKSTYDKLVGTLSCRTTSPTAVNAEMQTRYFEELTNNKMEIEIDIYSLEMLYLKKLK